MNPTKRQSLIGESESADGLTGDKTRTSRKAVCACILGVLQVGYLILSIVPPNALSRVIAGYERFAFFMFSIEGVLALILGLSARLDIHTSEGRLDGAELALIGVVGGAVSLGMVLLSLILVPGF